MVEVVWSAGHVRAQHRTERSKRQFESGKQDVEIADAAGKETSIDAEKNSRYREWAIKRTG